MVELPEDWKPIVNALLKAPVAWQTPAQVSAALGQDVEVTADLLCLMNETGWLDIWDADPEPCVVFSALAAERLSIHLVEVGANEVPRWARAGDPLPPGPKAKNVSRMEQTAALDLVPDPSLSPDQEAERAEQAEILAERVMSKTVPRRAREELPFPTLLLGQQLSPWPGPAPTPKSLCPACGDRPLRSHEYCLYCDRWGLDELLSAAALSKTRRPSPPQRRRLGSADQARQVQFLAKREREKRKARRAEKKKAKIETGRLRKQKPATPSKTQVTAQDEEPKPASDKARS